MDVTYLYLCMIGVSNTILYHFPAFYIVFCLVLCRIPVATTIVIHIIITTLVPLRAHIDTPGECVPVYLYATYMYVCLVTYGMCLQVRLSNRSVCLSVAKTILKCALYTALSSF